MSSLVSLMLIVPPPWTFDGVGGGARARCSGAGSAHPVAGMEHPAPVHRDPLVGYVMIAVLLTHAHAAITPGEGRRLTSARLGTRSSAMARLRRRPARAPLRQAMPCRAHRARRPPGR